MPNEYSPVGIAWYRPEQWERLLEVSVDRSRLEDTHEEWETGAKETLRNLLVNGANAIRVDVDVENLVQWCKKNGRAVDGSGRAFYVADRIRLLKK